MLKLISVGFIILTCGFLLPPRCQTKLDSDLQKKVIPIISAKTLSLEELSKQAETIFVGRVTRVDSTKILIGDKKRTVHQIVISVTIYIKKPESSPSELVVTQHPLFASNVKKGDNLLWFLPPRSKLGLVSPLAYYSGDFRLVKNRECPDYYDAVNLRGNTGLWPTRSRVWNKKFNPTAVKNAMRYNELPKLRRSQIDKLTVKFEKAYTPQLLPLEFIMGATKTYLAQRKK